VVCAILHDINLASLFADQLVFLSPDGQMICGHAERVCNPQAISQIFAVETCQLVHPQNNRPVIVASI
jgi:ABC-type hemin transport system ATPase subunit